MGKRPRDHAHALTRWQRRIRNFRRPIYGWAAAGAAAVLLRCPYRVLRPVSRTLTAPVLRLIFRRRADRNLTTVLPDLALERRTKILDEVFRGTSTLAAEWIGAAKLGREFFELYVDDAQGRQQMETLEANWDGGWIGITGHMGNWELLGQWLHNTSRRPSASLAKKQPNPHLNKVIERLRGRHGRATIYRHDPPGKILRLLRDGGSLGIAADEDAVTMSGVFIDFLGRPAYTPLGPARLAIAANVPIMVGAMFRRGERFEVQLNTPIWPDRKAPRDEEILRLTRAWSAELQEIIRKHPEQWPWFHDRWKTTPEVLERKKRRQLSLNAS
ncbi:MAG: hypothetical protein AAF628_30340 [Planctomycetota bacterium]